MKNREFLTGIEKAKFKTMRAMKAEGFSEDQVNYRLYPVLRKNKYSERVLIESEVNYSFKDLEALLLEASGELHSWLPVVYPDAGEDYSNALSSWRPVYWGKGNTGTPIFNLDQLKTGNEIVGRLCATTYSIFLINGGY